MCAYVKKSFPLEASPTRRDKNDFTQNFLFTRLKAVVYLFQNNKTTISLCRATGN